MIPELSDLEFRRSTKRIIAALNRLERSSPGAKEKIIELLEWLVVEAFTDEAPSDPEEMLNIKLAAVVLYADAIEGRL